MYSLVSTMNLPSSLYGYGNKLDRKPQEDDDDQSTGSSTSKDKRGKLGFRSVLKKCASFRGLSNKNNSSSRSLTAELALSISILSVEDSDVACQVVVRPFSTETEEVQTRSLENAKNDSSSLHDFLEEYNDIIMVDEYAELTPVRRHTKESSLADCLDGVVPRKEKRMDGRRSHSARPLSVEESDVSCQVVVRGKAPSSPVKAPSSPKLLLPTTSGATSRRPGLPYRSCSVRSLAIPSAVPRKEKRMDGRRSHSARPFSSEIEEVQTRSLENANNSLHDWYDDIIMLEEYAELTPVHRKTNESSLADCLDAYSRMINEEDTGSMKYPSL
jgi:hypothetical protein